MTSTKTLADVALITFFLSAVWLPFADKLVPLDPVGPRMENRRIAGFPSLDGGLELVETFPSDFESYFNDHFGFRNSLIKGHCLLKYRLFGDSGSSSVLVGKDGWLFYGTQETLDCYRGVDPFAPEELEAWRSMLEARRDALAELGIRYLFVFVPNKHTVYPEKLPDRLNVVNETSRLDQLTAHLRAHTDVEFIDLRDTLIRGKKRAQTYERTGTHWTATGMFFCQTVILEHLRQWFPNLAPVEPRRVRPRTELVSGSGLARMLGMEEELMEERTNLRIVRSRSRRGELDDNLGRLIPIPSLAPEVYTGGDPSLPRLMLVGDSFGQGMTGMISSCFSRSVFVWHEFDLEVIAREKPDVVINQVVERYLMLEHPKDMRKLSNFHRPGGE